MITKLFYLHNEIKIFILSVLAASIFISCGTADIGQTQLSDDTIPAITLNVQAEYEISDSNYRAKGDMIKQLSLIDLIGDESRTFKKGVPNENYNKTVKYFKDRGTWNIELIDYKGNMRDTIVSFAKPGEYTIRIPIILDNATPFEISEYLNTLGEGRVIIDQIAN